MKKIFVQQNYIGYCVISKITFVHHQAQFWNYNIENDILGFPVIQRELRHSIEAYLDLYNLVNDEKYKCVLSYCANSNKKKKNKIELGKYKEYLYKNEFTIRSKYKISGLENEKLMDMSSKANSYTHPDVYLNLTEICNNKDALLRDLIEMNFYLLSEAFDLFVKGIKNYGASTYLLNNYITAYGVQYYYRDLYKNKKNNAFEFIKNSLIVNQQVLNQQNYIISG